VACLIFTETADVHDLRRRVPVLSRQELDRAISEPGIGDADPIDNLFARSSLTIVFAERALRQENAADFNSGGW